MPPENPPCGALTAHLLIAPTRFQAHSDAHEETLALRAQGREVSKSSENREAREALAAREASEAQCE